MVSTMYRWWVNVILTIHGHHVQLLINKLHLGEQSRIKGFKIKSYFLQACSLSSSAASVRTFQRPEETLEESLVARGVNTEGYSFLGRTSSLGPLSRGRSLHVANSKFYVKGMGALLANTFCTCYIGFSLLCL